MGNDLPGVEPATTTAMCAIGGVASAAVASAALWGMTTTFGPQTSLTTVVAWHVVLNTGLALMFSPLMTNALGSLPRRLYPHGSAIVATMQQVAGAAGTALFITVMTTAQVAGAQAGTAASALATAVEHNLAIVWLVMNNNAFGTIGGLQKAAYGLTHGTLFPTAEGGWSEQVENIARHVEQAP